VLHAAIQPGFLYRRACGALCLPGLGLNWRALVRAGVVELVVMDQKTRWLSPLCVLACLCYSFAGLAAMSVVSTVLAFAQEEAALKKRGELLLATNCSRCHAIGRTGASRHPDALPFRTLSSRYPVEALAETLAEGISVGNPDMPEFVFEHDEIAAILAYLKSIQDH
jgi:cytochrome c